MPTFGNQKSQHFIIVIFPHPATDQLFYLHLTGVRPFLNKSIIRFTGLLPGQLQQITLTEKVIHTYSSDR